MKNLKKYLFSFILFGISTVAASQQIAASCILVYERGAKMMRADGNEPTAKNFEGKRKVVLDVYTKEYGKSILDKAVAKDRKHWESVEINELLDRLSFCNKDVLGIGK
jgi:hypothetical protein